MKFMSLGVRELHKKEVDGEHQEKKALRVNRSKALMNSQRLKQHRHRLQGLPAPGLQSTPYGSRVMILWDCWGVIEWISDSYALSWTLFLLLVCLAQI